jgi:hypothetical protein
MLTIEDMVAELLVGVALVVCVVVGAAHAAKSRAAPRPALLEEAMRNRSNTVFMVSSVASCE